MLIKVNAVGDKEMFRCAQHDNYVDDANEEMFRCAQHDSNALNMTAMLKRRRHCHPEQREGSLKVNAQHDNCADNADEEMFRCAQHDSMRST